MGNTVKQLPVWDSLVFELRAFVGGRLPNFDFLVSMHGLVSSISRNCPIVHNVSTVDRLPDCSNLVQQFSIVAKQLICSNCERLLLFECSNKKIISSANFQINHSCFKKQMIKKLSNVVKSLVDQKA